MQQNNSKEEKIFKAHIMDRHGDCFNKNFKTVTEFLNLNQQTIINGMKKDFYASYKLWGGYDDAERKVLCFYPQWDDGDMSEFLKIIKVSHSGYKQLSHRDYLGSVLSLGISRDYIGDILVFDGYALIIVKSEMADFIELNYSKAGKTNLTAEILGIDKIETPEYNIKEIADTVSSLRLDAVVSSAFSVSRGTAASFILAGAVYVNDILVEKVDFKVSEGSKIKVQKKGRAILKEVGGLSRKGRIAIKIERYM